MPTKNKPFLSLKPQFQTVIWNILIELESEEFKPAVIEGLRTKAQQAEKVRLGYSKTMNSIHLSGLAADICDTREMWDKGLVRPFWWALYKIAKAQNLTTGRLRYGLTWDKSERAIIYKKVLDDLMTGKLTQKQADEKITWFCDVAHIELKL